MRGRQQFKKERVMYQLILVIFALVGVIYGLYDGNEGLVDYGYQAAIALVMIGAIRDLNS